MNKMQRHAYMHASSIRQLLGSVVLVVGSGLLHSTTIELGILLEVLLEMNLGRHACKHRIKHSVRNAIYEPRQLAQRLDDNSQYVADAGQHLKAIREPNHAVVARVVGEVVLVHGKETGGGHGGAHAAEGLQAQAEVRTGGLSNAAGLDAAAALRADVALAADVPRHVVIQNLLAS
jgi:hypothetical protein